MNALQTAEPSLAPADLRPSRKGFLDARKVRAVSFYVMALCLMGSAVACILAIWDFTNKDTLWRTVATCVVIAAASGAFSMLNAMFGADSDC